jgi:prepilin signal peptidase PulO-like enzyme (type II secretory pathway)
MRVLTFCGICAILFVSTLVGAGYAALEIISRLGAVLILSGVYLALYLVSKGKKATAKKYGQLVGDGDWLLALPLAVMLGDWWLALVALTLANLLGSFVALPLLATKKAKTGSMLPLGPFLITAFWVVFLAQPLLLMLK